MWRLENEAAARVSRLYGFGGRAKFILHKLFSYRMDNDDNGEHHWVIPENIHTIPRAASWNSEGEGGFLGLEFRRRGGGGG